MYKIKNLFKKYIDSGKNELVAIDDISIDFPESGLVMIVGKSGCGKSTLLNMLGGIEKQTSGEVWFDGQNITSLNIAQLVEFRQKVGFVFQDFNLIYDFSVYQNIEIVNSDKDSINHSLNLVELQKKKDTKVRYLSGGERQRLAIARCLSKQSKVMLLDEPTGNLDSSNSKLIFDILKQISTSMLVVVVTHDDSVVHQYADYVLHLIDGKVQDYKKIDNKLSIDIELSHTLDNSIYKIVDFALNISNGDDVRLELVSAQNNIVIDTVVSKSNVLDFLVTTLKRYTSGQVSISCYVNSEEIKNSSSDNKSNSIPQKPNNSFTLPLKFCAKYSLGLIKNKISRTVICVLLLVVSLSLAFFQTNLLMSSTSDLLYNALVQNDEYLLPVTQTQYNSLTNQDVDISIGKTFYDNIHTSTDSKVVPYLQSIILVHSDDADVEWDQNINIVSDDMWDDLSLNLVSGVMPSASGQVLITDITSVLMFGNVDSIGKQIDIDIKTIGFFATFSFEICGVIDTGYSHDDLQYIIDRPNDYRNNISNKYISSFISLDTFYESINSLNKINIQGVPFDITKKPSMLDYISNSFLVGRADRLVENNNINSDKQIAYNNKIFDSQLEYNHIVVSRSIFERNKYYFGAVDAQDIIGREYNFMDISKSPNFVLYQQLYNIFEALDKVVVDDVVDVDLGRADVYISTQLYSDIISQAQVYFINGFEVLASNSYLKNTVNKIARNNFDINISYLIPIYKLQSLKSSSFQNVLYVIEILLAFSAFVSLFFFCILNVNSKLKEINILKSLGFKDTKVALIFFLQNLFIVAFSFIIAIVLSTIGISVTNNILHNPDVLNINYNILIIKATSILLILVASIILAILATITPFIKIHKSDISTQIKLA